MLAAGVLGCLLQECWGVGCRSVGVLAYVMLTGCAPFAGSSKQETMLNISQVNLDFPDDLFSSISTDAVNFIRGLLTKKTKFVHRHNSFLIVYSVSLVVQLCSSRLTIVGEI